jgi:hypothetical protein
VGEGERRVVKNPPLRITRAASQSFGKQTKTEFVEDPDLENWEDWVPGDIDRIEEGDPLRRYANVPSKFGMWADRYAQVADTRQFPVESMFGELSEEEEKRVLERASQRDPFGSRVRRDPVTRIPENVSWADPLSESDKFFGEEKYPRQFERTLNRMEQVDRKQERVDYRSSRAIPIKVVRGGVR